MHTIDVCEQHLGLDVTNSTSNGVVSGCDMLLFAASARQVHL